MTPWLLQDATQAVSCSRNYMGSLWTLKELRLQLSQTSTWTLFIWPFLLSVSGTTVHQTQALLKFKTDDTRYLEGCCFASVTHPRLNPDLFFSHLRNWRREEAGVPGAAHVCDQGGGRQHAAALRGHWLPCTAHTLDVWRQAARRKVWTWILAISWIDFIFLIRFRN